MKDKTKKNIKDTIKDIIALICIVGLIFGGYKLYENYKSNQANSDESYKVKTERNKKYNGVYSLTKLDNDDKNTWDGLMLYVKNDKIISATNFDYTSEDNIRKQIKNLMGNKEYTLNNEEDLVWQAVTDLGLTTNQLDLPNGVETTLSTGFFSGTGGFTEGPGAQLATKGAFVCKDKVDFERVTDIKTDYDYMQSCDIVPGYDEDSKEVWLSKLLSNKKSIYHDGYKLIHYNGYDDIQKNCKLDNGGCIDKLNKEFNADL